jgi:hypothetical protein
MHELVRDTTFSIAAAWLFRLVAQQSATLQRRLRGRTEGLA